MRRFTFLRARPREVLTEQEREGGDTEEIRSRVDVLLALSRPAVGARVAPPSFRPPAQDLGEAGRLQSQGVERPPGLPQSFGAGSGPAQDVGGVDHGSTRPRQALELGEAQRQNPYRASSPPEPRRAPRGAGVVLDYETAPSEQGSQGGQGPERDDRFDRLADALTRMADNQQQPRSSVRDEESKK